MHWPGLSLKCLSKRRLLRAAALALLPAAALAQNSVHGVVLDSVTRQPVARVLVEPSAAIAPVLTDSTGQFSFSDLPSGTVTLNFRRPGYFDPATNATATTRSLNVANNSPEQTVLLAPAATLRGRLSLADDDSPTGLRVELLQASATDGHRQWRVLKQATVRSTGEFTFGDLQAGRYLLHAEASLDPEPPGRRLQPLQVRRSGYVPAYAPSTPDLAAATVFTLRPGQIADAQLELSRAIFYPVAIALHGEPGGSFHVTGNGFTRWNVAYSREDGMLRTTLPSGAYTLHGRSSGRNPAEGELLFRVDGKPVQGPALTMTTGTSVTLNTTVEASDAGSSEPANQPGVTGLTLIPVSGEDGLTFLPVRTGSPTGTQQVEGTISPGRYWVAAHANGGYLAALASGGVDLLRNPLTVSAGQQLELTATLRQDGGSVSPVLTGEAQAQSCTVHLVPLSPGGQEQEFFSTSTGVGFTPGGFGIDAVAGSLNGGSSPVFRDVAPGDYLLVATPQQGNLDFREPGVLQQLTGARITVEPGGQLQPTLSKLTAGPGAP